MTAPTVNVGADRSLIYGQVLTLVAAASDPESGALSYAWTLPAKPTGSLAEFDNPAAAQVAFGPDLVGEYTLRCTVTDPESLTAFDELIVTVRSTHYVKSHVKVGKYEAAIVDANVNVERVRANKYTPGLSGLLTSGYVRCRVENTSQQTKMCIYSDSSGVPGTLLAVSDEKIVSNTTTAVNKFTFSGANSIEIDTVPYWIGFVSNIPSGENFFISRDDGGNYQASPVFAYPAIPSTFGSPTAGTAGPLDVWIDVLSTKPSAMRSKPAPQFQTLWTADYDLAGPAGQDATAGTNLWQSEQPPNNPGSAGPLATTRLTIVGPASVPGSGINKPKGNALRAELRPYDSGNGDVQGGTYNRAESYARHAVPGSTPPSNWADPVGTERWYGWSVFVPTDFVEDSTAWETLTQWKGYRSGSPRLALEVKQNYFRMGGEAGNQGHLSGTEQNIGSLNKGNWTRFVFGMFWSETTTGWLKVYRNGVLELDKPNLQTMNLYNGTVDPNYLKQGIYRSSAWTVTHIIHFSAPVIAPTKADVDGTLAELLLP